MTVYRHDLWAGNFRELSASVTRLATLARAGRISEDGVAEEIARLRETWSEQRDSPLDRLPGDRVDQLDLFDRLQLEKVVEICQQSKSLSDAGRRPFSVSRQERAKVNDADRLRKYLARFGVEWHPLQNLPESS